MLTVKKLSFRYQSRIPVLRNIDFEIKDGEFITVIGESGSGKSTLLKLLYGLEDADKGEILLSNQKVTGPKFNLVPGHESMKFVPQEFGLSDPETAGQNTGKYLSNFDIPSKERNIKKALRVVSLLKYKDTIVSQMSGGQRQRIAISRALAAKPEVLLLDEPYNQLDHRLKFRIRKRLYQWAKENKVTVILTTHDINDAMGFSDRIFLMRKGKLIQKGTPEEIRKNPVSRYVAGILGVFTQLKAEEMKKYFDITIPTDKTAVIYPEEFKVSSEGFPFKVKDCRFMGRDYLIEAKEGHQSLWFYSDNKLEESEIRLFPIKYRLLGK